MNREELKAKYGDEKVLCIKNSNIERNKSVGVMNLIKYYGYLDYRYNAELNFNAKQIIPYIVIKSDDKVFVAKRLKGDPRLVGGYTVGMGGHIDSSDVILTADRHIDAEMTVGLCIQRELTEETNIDLDSIKNIELVTDFVDDSSEVSKVHMCLLYTIDVGYFDLKIKETDKLDGFFVAVNELHDMYDSLEGWGKISTNLLFPKPKEWIISTDIAKPESKSVVRRKKVQRGEEILTTEVDNEV